MINFFTFLLDDRFINPFANVESGIRSFIYYVTLVFQICPPPPCPTCNALLHILASFFLLIVTNNMPLPLGALRLNSECGNVKCRK